jgi:hypothetical protein
VEFDKYDNVDSSPRAQWAEVLAAQLPEYESFRARRGQS